MLFHLLGVRPRHGQQIIRDPVRVDSPQGGLGWTPTARRNLLTGSVLLRPSPFCTFILAAPPSTKHGALHLGGSVPPQALANDSVAGLNHCHVCYSLESSRYLKQRENCFVEVLFLLPDHGDFPHWSPFGFQGTRPFWGPRIRFSTILVNTVPDTIPA